MNIEEFKAKCAQEEDWAPGWDAIDGAFNELYPNQEPFHYGTIITSRAIFGGPEYLDGYSYFTSPKGYCHVVTYGMTELYQNEEMFGDEFNKWGYEMTMKVNGTPEEHKWVGSFLGHLASYTYKTERYFDPFQYVGLDIRELVNKPESKMSAFLIVPDSEVETIDTIYGKTMFLQLVPITENEFNIVKENRDRVDELYQALKKHNPDFVVDFDRTEDLITL